MKGNLAPELTPISFCTMKLWRERKISRLFTASLLAASLLHLGSPTPFSYAQTEEVVKDASTEINVKNADIAAVIRIFSKRTKRNYILDERVKGKVTIYLPGKVSSDEAIKILDSVLSLKGFTSVPIGENLWKIIPAAEARQTTIPTVTDSDGRGTAAIVTRLVNLKFVNADDVKQLLGPLVSQHGLMNAYTGTNSLILIDSEDNINRLAKIIESIDIPFSDREMTIIEIEHADAADVAEKLSQILGEEEGDSSASTGNPQIDLIRNRLRESANRTGGNTRATPAAVNAPSGAAVTVAARARAPKIIADERTNSIIIVSDEDTTARIRALVSQLDSPMDLSGNRFYVYRCQHANAEELADVLAGLVGGGGGSSSSSSRSSFGGSSFNDSSDSRSSRGSQLGRSSSRFGNQGRDSSDQGSSRNSSPTSVQFGEDVSITADPATNSLIINAGKTDYLKITELLQQLDVKRRQVLVEALILEVGVSDDLSTSAQFIGSIGGSDGGAIAMNNLGDLETLFSQPQQLSQFTMAAASAGSLRLPGITLPTQTLLVRAAQTASNVNVLSAPNILATDNESAEIVVGQNVPFLASTSTNSTNLNNTFNQIDRQDVGITLRITPQISSSDFVTLQLFTEVSNVIPGTEGSELGPTTTIRTSETTVITKNEQMIVTGGLMSDDIQESETGVPYLRNIPVLGHLFREHADRQRRTNLLIFITPRIIKDQFDARDVSIDGRDRMKKEIEYYEVYPNREEVTGSIGLDRVTESGDVKFDKDAGTIRVPKEPLGTQSTSQISQSERTVIDASNGEPIVLDLSADGNSPNGMARQDVPEEIVVDLSSNGNEGTARIAENRPPSNEESSNEVGSIVVLERTSLDPLPNGLPFQLTEEKGRVAIALPSSVGPATKAFFKTGERCSYGIESGIVDFSVLGVFPSLQEASKVFGDLSLATHPLTPYEIMSIGDGPWFRG